jgi:long-chain acyl-CoA synthetase
MLSLNKTYRAPPQSGEVILGRTLPELLDEACVRSANSQALNNWTETGWKPFSNQAFRSAALELALFLLNLQLEKGERVALLMHSDINFCIADMGSLLAGLVNVPIDLTETIEHIIFILQQTEAKVLIISNLDLLHQIIPYLFSIPNLKTVIVADVSVDWRQNVERGRYGLYPQVPTSPDLCLSLPQFLLQSATEQSFSEIPQCIQLFSLDEVCARGKVLISETSLQELRSELSANDLATIIYIPGVSGEPHGVMLTHENLSANAMAMFTGIPDMGLGMQEVVLSFLPLTHVFARVLLYGHVNYGHSIYFSNPNRIVRHLKDVKPTIFATIPLFLEKIYSKLLFAEGKKEGEKGEKKEGNKRIRTQAFSIFLQWSLKLAQKYEIGKQPQGQYALMLMLASRLVFQQWRSFFGGRLKYLICGGAALKGEIANLFAAAGITIFQGYGLTETSSAVTCNRGRFNRAGTVGVPVAGVEIAIADDGEILTKSPYITQGYYKNPKATQQLIDADGWLHTGDLGEFTSDGFLKIIGLKKSRFKLSTGKYVTSQPIENKLKKSSLVKNAVTVGSERKFCTMLIFPNLEKLSQYALSIGIDLPTDDLLKHPCINGLYQALVDEANCHLPHWSTVKKFQLINADLTVNNGMLTLTQEVNRAKVTEVFAKEINSFYQDSFSLVTRSGNKDKFDDICPEVPQFLCPAYAQSLNS